MFFFFLVMFVSQMDLFQEGVSIVPIFSSSKIKTYREGFQNIQFPEFQAPTSSYVMGGFGAYGNPSSFHNEVVRQMRMEAYPIMKEFFQQQFQQEKNNKTFYLEQLFDRMCVRKKNSSIPKETWHRDLSPMVVEIHDPKKKEYQVKQDEHVFGGWINLDEEPQYFSCSLRTHREKFLMKKKGNGFALQTKPDPTTTSATMVEVPSGHAIVFYQNILHQVLPKKQKQDSFRLFQSFRIVSSTTPPSPLHGQETIQQWIEDQATPLLPSGQHPPMYSSNHSSVFLFSGGKNDPIEFSKAFHPSCLISNTCQGEKNKGRPYSIVPRQMTSLCHYQLPLYPPYTQEETNLFFPQKLI